MKSYLQGLITGAVFAFAFFVFTGSSKVEHRPNTWVPFSDNIIMNTTDGALLKRGLIFLNNNKNGIMGWVPYGKSANESAMMILGAMENNIDYDFEDYDIDD